MKAVAHVVVSGRVQGVCFRYATADEAVCRGVSGWVQNLPDGRVEAVFEGEEDAVEEMIAFCRQGPPAARVEAVEVRRVEPSGAFENFSIRH